MLFLTLLLSLPLALGEKLVIPAVQSAVAQQLAEFEDYTAYTGPMGSVKAALSNPIAHAKVLAQLLAVNPAAVAAIPQPYWYEQIPHQGIAAFNTNTSYKVYRNVKDYGAKGCVRWRLLL